MRQLRAADELTELTPLLVRPYLAGFLSERADGGLTVSSRAGEVIVAAGERDAFVSWWHAGGGTTGDLGAGLARTLVLTGLAVTG